LLHRELPQGPALEQEQAGALGSDPEAFLRVLVERPDLLTTQALEQRLGAALLDVIEGRR
jgi:hypothetical protein